MCLEDSESVVVKKDVMDEIEMVQKRGSWREG